MKLDEFIKKFKLRKNKKNLNYIKEQEKDAYFKKLSEEIDYNPIIPPYLKKSI